MCSVRCKKEKSAEAGELSAKLANGTLNLFFVSPMKRVKGSVDSMIPADASIRSNDDFKG
jgi:hypothetical protein